MAIQGVRRAVSLQHWVHFSLPTCAEEKVTGTGAPVLGDGRVTEASLAGCFTQPKSRAKKPGRRACPPALPALGYSHRPRWGESGSKPGGGGAASRVQPRRHTFALFTEKHDMGATKCTVAVVSSHASLIFFLSLVPSSRLVADRTEEPVLS